jgi:hypothetical protein
VKNFRIRIWQKGPDPTGSGSPTLMGTVDLLYNSKPLILTSIWSNVGLRILNTAIRYIYNRILIVAATLRYRYLEQAAERWADGEAAGYRPAASSCSAPRHCRCCCWLPPPPPPPLPPPLLPPPPPRRTRQDPDRPEIARQCQSVYWYTVLRSRSWSRSQSFFDPAPAPEPGMKIFIKCYTKP